MQLMGVILYLVLSSEIVLAATVKRNNESGLNVLDSTFQGEIFTPDYWWESLKEPQADANRTSLRAIEEDILNSLSRLDMKEKHRIFDDLKKQKTSHNFKPLTLAESDGPSPLNVVELKAVQKSIRTSNRVLPNIRNKRTLNFLLFAVARAMGYVLIPRNPDPRMISVQSHPCKGIERPPPCAPPPPSSPPPTIPPNQIDANTIRYPYRPSQQIPLLQFAPLPPGVVVPYPPLLQRPCDPPQPTPKSNSCTIPTKVPPPSPTPPPCVPRPPPPPPPCAKNSHHSCSLPKPPSQPPPPLPPCQPHQRCPPPSNQPPPPCQSHQKCTPPPSSTQPPPPTPRCRNQPSCQPPPPKKSPPPKHKPLILEYDHPVKIQIFNNVRKFLPASGTTYSGIASKSSAPEKLEEYERLDEEAQMEDESDAGYIQKKIFRNDEETAPNEEMSYEDSQDEIQEDLYSGESENKEDAEEPVRFYERRMVSEPNRKFRVNTNSIEDVSKQNGYFKSPVWDRPPKKAVLKRVIKIKKPVTKQIDENGNEYTFARSTIHEIRKRDLQDFDFIRKYKENQEEGEDDQYKDENPRGRTTTSIRKIEVKKFVVNKSEDEPIEHHEKTERNFEHPPHRAALADQEQQREEEDEGGDQDERVSYKEYEPPDHEERREMEKALENELENEEELIPPKSVVYESPPPTEKGVQYVRKTITKYVSGTGGKETIKYVPIYKVIHTPPPPPPPPQVRKIIHHHHHRIPVYPKIIVRTGSAAKRKPSFLAHFGNAGNLLLVTIRERNG